MPSTALVDTGALFAAADASDRWHHACAELLESYPNPLLVPQLVVAETAYLLRSRLGTRNELLFLSELARGTLRTEPVAPSDWPRILELAHQYRDFPLGTTDASVVTCAERLRLTTVITIDCKHFTAVRPRHVEAFELLP